MNHPLHKLQTSSPNVPSQGNGLRPVFSSVKSAVFEAMPTSPKKDLGQNWFLDDTGGSIDGLMSYTESLGFESCRERMVDENNTIIEELSDHRYHHYDYKDGSNSYGYKRLRVTRISEMKKEVKFSPPLTSLNQNRQPSFVLRLVRKDGLLEITEVRIQWSEILHTLRQNGWLPMHLVTSIKLKDEIEKQEETAKEEEGSWDAEDGEELGKEELAEEEEEVEERGGGEEWNLEVNGGRGKGKGGVMRW